MASGEMLTGPKSMATGTGWEGSGTVRGWGGRGRGREGEGERRQGRGRGVKAGVDAREGESDGRCWREA